MKLVSVSDLHGVLPTNVPSADVFVIAGDICPLHDHSIAFQQSWLDTNFRAWLKNIDAKYKIFIFGNHDLIGEYPSKVVKLFGEGTNFPGIYLQDSFVEYEGVKFWGSPWIPPIWGAFQAEESALKEIYSKIPIDTTVVISHSPPFGIGDLAPKRWTPETEEEWPSNEHCGSHALRERLFDINPPLTLWGHIHGSYGIYSIGDNIGANVALLDDSYTVKNKPLTFILENNKVVASY